MNEEIIILKLSANAISRASLGHLKTFADSETPEEIMRAFASLIFSIRNSIQANEWEALIRLTDILLENRSDYYETVSALKIYTYVRVFERS